MVNEDIPAGLRTNANWRRLWLGQAVSLVGDFVFNTTVVLWVGTVITAGRPWAPAAVGAVLIASAAPVLLVGPMAGVFVDRWDHRRTMMVADLVRAGLVALLLLAPLLRGSPMWLQLASVYAVVALVSASAQFFNPARFAVIAATVCPDDQPRAFGLATATSSAAGVIGPPLAAPLLFGAGVQVALVVDVASFLISFLAVWSVRTPRRQAVVHRDKAGFWIEFTEGLRFFSHKRELVVIAGAICLTMLGVGAINVLDVFFVTDNLHTKADWLGTITAAFGVGSIVGALFAGRIAKRIGAARIFGWGIVLAGLLVLVYSRTNTLAMAIAVLAFAGIPISVVNVVLGPLILKATPKNLLGRVNAVMNPLVFLSSILSMALSGFLVSTALRDLRVRVVGITFTRIDTVFAISGLLMVIAGLLSLPSLAARSDDGPNNVEPDHAVTEAMS